MMKDTLVVVTGPTAVGKTELCLDIAGHYGIPIINADSRQIYKGLRIGTAAPTKDQLQKVKHYFVGTLELEDYYNASMYEQEVMRLLTELFAGDGRHIALMTGGSMMYIDSVCNGIDDIPAVNAETRELLKERLEHEGLEKLCSELKVLDPEYYSIVDRKNTRRVIHGLEICYQTGKPYTYFRKKEKRQRPFNIIKIALNRPREELYGRINSRVDEMLHDGLLEEARTLYPYRELNALNTVGYKEIFEYFDGSFSMGEAVERIKGNTRRYARKQLTWFKRDEKVRWFAPNDKNEIMNYISQEYEKEF
ncbi:MAG: tRNA (adenosine(37)-N6)-dimethylallyltransferase MiaA [Prevotella sp.]|nr:tRNA (adenosine(37)-N6)-dimethylallyltransferase MiaA [Prevotella sp.]